jgi:hypothetical protein
MPCDPDVVDEDVQPSELRDGVGDGAFGLARIRGRLSMGALADAWSLPAATRDDVCAFGEELPRDLEPDPSRRAGGEAPLPSSRDPRA